MWDVCPVKVRYVHGIPSGFVAVASNSHGSNALS